MPDRPAWIDDRLQPNVRNKLTQTHVVDSMLESERPFFSITQLEAELKPDVDRGTIRNRLTELQELDIVTEHAYPGVSLFHIKHPESEWPLSPEGKRALDGQTRLDTISITDLLTLRDTKAIDTIVTSGAYLAMLMIFLSMFMTSAGISAPIESSHGVLTAALHLLMLVISILLLRWVVNGVRNSKALGALRTGGMF